MAEDPCPEVDPEAVEILEVALLRDLAERIRPGWVWIHWPDPAPGP